MAATLEQAVEAGKWLRLCDKLFAEQNLLAAFQQAATRRDAAGVDHLSAQQFQRALPETLREVSDQLRRRTYQLRSIRLGPRLQAGNWRTTAVGHPRGARSDGPGGGGPGDRVDRSNAASRPKAADFGRDGAAKTPCVELHGLPKAGSAHAVEADPKGCASTRSPATVRWNV